MDIQAKVANLEAQHAENARAYQQALAQAEQYKIMLIKIEGALDILRELQAEQEPPADTQHDGYKYNGEEEPTELNAEA